MLANYGVFKQLTGWDIDRRSAAALLKGLGGKQTIRHSLWLPTATMQIGSGCTPHLQADELPN